MVSSALVAESLCSVMGTGKSAAAVHLLSSLDSLKSVGIGLHHSVICISSELTR